MTHILKLLDKMCKYVLDLASIVEDTEWTRFCPEMERRTDGQTGKVKPVYLPFNFVEAEGIINISCLHFSNKIHLNYFHTLTWQ